MAELYIDDRWVKATPTYDIAHCKKMGLPAIDFNGEDDAMLPALGHDGRLNVEYIHDRGSFADLPLNRLRRLSLSRRYVTS